MVVAIAGLDKLTAIFVDAIAIFVGVVVNSVEPIAYLVQIIAVLVGVIVIFVEPVAYLVGQITILVEAIAILGARHKYLKMHTGTKKQNCCNRKANTKGWLVARAYINHMHSIIVMGADGCK